MRKVVNAGKDASDLAGLQTRRERIGGISSSIDRGLAIEPEQATVAIRVGRQAVMVLPAVRSGRQVLPAILDPAQRVREPARRPCQRDFFSKKDSLVAETAADVGRDHADAPLVDSETFGETRANDVGLLGRADDDQLVEAAVAVGDHAPPFQRTHDLARRPQFANDRDGRPGLERREIDVDVGRQEEIVAPPIVHQRRAGLACCQHVVHRWQWGEIDLDPRCDVFRLGAGRGDAHRDRFPDMPYLVDRQHWLR